MTILEKIDQYRELLDKKDDLAEQTKANNLEIIAVRDELAQMMIDAETPKVTRGGYGYTLTAKSKFNRAAGVTEEQLIDVFRMNGLGDLVKETIPAQTVQSTIRGLTEENDDVLPEEFADVITRYDYFDVTPRKERNTARKAAL